MTKASTDKEILQLSDKQAEESLEAMKNREDRYRNRKIRIENPKPEAKTYLENLHKKKRVVDIEGVESKINRIWERRTTPAQIMPYSEGKRVMWLIIEKWQQVKGREYILDGNLKETIQNLVKYLIYDPSSKYDLNKGLYFWSAQGVGKTQLLEFAEKFCLVNRIESRVFNTELCTRIHDQVTLHGVNACFKYFTGSHAFDDLGKEETYFSHFGNNIRVMERVLDEKYNLFESKGIVCHITSNIPPNEISNRYGTRLSDRLNGMANIVELVGNGKR